MESTLNKTLTDAAADLYYPSESDEPFTFFEWELPTDKKPDKEIVLEAVNKPANTPVEEKEFDAFFSKLTTVKDWYGDEEKEGVKKFEELKKALEDNLKHIQVFRVGEIEVDVYIVGQTPEGKWAGLATKSIET